MLPQNIKTRISKDGFLRFQLKEMRRIKNEHADSQFARKILFSLYKKYLFGSKSVTYKSIYENAWSLILTTPDDVIIRIADMLFVNDPALTTEYTDIFLTNNRHKYPLFEGEKEVAQKILSFLSSEGSYETEKVVIEKDNIIIDAGANMGLFSLFSAKLGVKKVYAFEPQRQAIEILNRNILMNGFSNIIVPVNLGLSDKNEETVLSYSDIGHSSASIILKRDGVINEDKIECVTLDSWAHNHNINQIDFIKADIEGAERNLLIGATNILKDIAPKLAICTYHLPDDPEVLHDIILSANNKYQIEHTSHKLFARIP